MASHSLVRLVRSLRQSRNLSCRLLLICSDLPARCCNPRSRARLSASLLPADRDNLRVIRVIGWPLASSNWLMQICPSRISWPLTGSQPPRIPAASIALYSAMDTRSASSRLSGNRVVSQAMRSCIVCLSQLRSPGKKPLCSIRWSRVCQSTWPRIFCRVWPRSSSSNCARISTQGFLIGKEFITGARGSRSFFSSTGMAEKLSVPGAGSGFPDSGAPGSSGFR